MLGILLIYFIGKKFYELAGTYKKKQLAYAILGVVSYYIGTFFGGLTIAIGSDLMGSTPIEEMNEYALGIMALPFGLLACWIVYQMLKRTWRKATYVGDLGTLDDEFVSEQ